MRQIAKRNAVWFVVLNITVLFLLFPEDVSARTISLKKARKYVRGSWSIVEVTDNVLNIALKRSYEGIPYLDWISLLISFDDLHNRLDEGKYYKAIDLGFKFISGYRFADTVLATEIPGILTTANLAIAPIQYAIVKFRASSVKRALQNQIKLYLRARELGCSHESILDASCENVMLFTDNGWLYIVDEEYNLSKFAYPPSVPKNNPEDVYNLAWDVWNAIEEKAHYIEDKNTIGENLRQVVLSILNPASVPTLRISPNATTLRTNQTFQFEAWYDPDGSGDTPEYKVTKCSRSDVALNQNPDHPNDPQKKCLAATTWTADNITIISVDKGLVTGQSRGTTTLRASHNNNDASVGASVRVIKGSLRER